MLFQALYPDEDYIITADKIDLTNAGAKWIDREVVRDGNLITSRSPDDVPAFNRATIEAFSEVLTKRKKP